MEARSQALLCQEIESELRELCQECRRKFPVIKDYTERAILKIRHHRDLVEQQQQQAKEAPPAAPEFPLDEVLRAILMACETFQNKIVLLSLSCLQRLIHRRVLKDETIAIVINLMKEQASNGDETVQLKVLQTIMATPAHMTLLNELVVEQLMQLLYVLHNSNSTSVHHTACAGLRQLAEYLSDRAATAAQQLPNGPQEAAALQNIRPIIRRSPAAGMPTVAPAQAPSSLAGPLRMFFIFVQDLCVMADYDASSLSSRYAVDAGERMRTGSREGFWLAAIKFPRPLCLELLATCLATHPGTFAATPECFTLLRHNLCAVLLKSLRGCFDFAILIRSIQLLQQIFRCPALAAPLMPELQVFLHIMLDLTTAERSPWQRATSLEFLRSVCEDPTTLAVLYEHGGSSASSSVSPLPSPSPSPMNSPQTPAGSQTFLELVNSLSKLIHQVCFSSGMDSGALMHSSSASTAPLGHLVSSGWLLLLGSPNAFGHGGERPAGGGGGGAAEGQRERGGGASGGRVKLLQMMSETEPPAIVPSFLVALVIESVFAVVSSLYRLLLAGGEAGPQAAECGQAPSTPTNSRSDGGGTSTNNSPSTEKQEGRRGDLAPLVGSQTSRTELCAGMLSDCWASLLSALALLLHGSTDEHCLQQALRCLQTLLYCSSKLGLTQARDACLQQLTRYTLPRDAAEAGTQVAGGTPASATGLTPKNVLCFRALVHYCHYFGGLLGAVGWGIALKALIGLERALQRGGGSFQPGQDLQLLRQGLDSLFETTACLSEDAICDLLEAMGQGLRSSADLEEGSVLLNRLVEICAFNLARFRLVWDRVFHVVTDVCIPDERGDLRGAATVALCRILAQALRKGGLASSEDPERAQEELLRHLEALLQGPHEDVRARVCEGLLQVLQASGQELYPAAWGMTIHLVGTAAQVELQRAGLVFALPRGPAAASVQTLPQMVFQLLELLVQDFLEYVPPSSVPDLTAAIGAFAKFPGLGVNSSLTAVGFLWNVADALARYHCSPPAAPDSAAPPEAGAGAAQPPGLGAQTEELWVQIFMQMRALAVDLRPEVRNCAVKSLTSALVSHGRKVGPACYRRCLEDILIEVLVEIQAAAQRAREGEGEAPGMERQRSDSLIVHHSRDTPEKQWDETLVLGVEGVRRVLSHFSEEAGVRAFAPLAYMLLLQVRATLHTLTTEVSGSALRTLVDLMRIPASSHLFDVEGTLVGDAALPVPRSGTTSIWLLGWSVVWGLVPLCLHREVPELLAETFASTLSALRHSHRHLFTPAQHAILLQLAVVLLTAPSFYLSQYAPLQLSARPSPDDEAAAQNALAVAAQACSSSCAEEEEIFRFAAESPQTLWKPGARTEGSEVYVKKPAEVTALITASGNRNSEIRAVEAILKEVNRNAGLSEEAAQAFLGSGQSPTYRTMLHASSARLQHVQNVIFSLLEETHSLPDPSLELLFICQCCAVFLDVRQVLRDANKIALAVRVLCLLLLFFRRTVLQNLGRLVCPGDDVDGAGPCPRANSIAHLEDLLGKGVPAVCRAATALVCSRGCPQLHACGLWRLALEVLVYIIEDTLPSLSACSLRPQSVSAYWEAVVGSLEEVVAQALLDSARREDSEDLMQAVGNLLTRRLLACDQVPPEISSRLMQVLEVLVGLRQGREEASGPVRYLFDLCAQGEGEGSEEDVGLSVAALSAQKTGALRLPAKCPHREALLGSAVPELLRRVCSLFDAFSGRSGEVSASKEESAELRLVLVRLRQLRLDETAAAALAGAGGERAKAACRLAGPRAFAMALLPRLAVLGTSGDAEIREEVKGVLAGLGEELGLGSLLDGEVVGAR